MTKPLNFHDQTVEFYDQSGEFSSPNGLQYETELLKKHCFDKNLENSELKYAVQLKY
jgi:hypothetical protein